MRTVRTLMLALVMTLAVAGLAVAALPIYDGTLIDWSPPAQFSSGGYFSQTFSRHVGSGYDIINVQLQGWDFNYASSDHHLNRLWVRIKEVSYNNSNGYVTVTVEGSFDDKNFDDDYHWQVWFTVLVLR